LLPHFVYLTNVNNGSRNGWHQQPLEVVVQVQEVHPDLLPEVVLNVPYSQPEREKERNREIPAINQLYMLS